MNGGNGGFWVRTTNQSGNHPGQAAEGGTSYITPSITANDYNGNPKVMSTLTGATTGGHVGGVPTPGLVDHSIDGSDGSFTITLVTSLSDGTPLPPPEPQWDSIEPTEGGSHETDSIYVDRKSFTAQAWG